MIIPENIPVTEKSAEIHRNLVSRLEDIERKKIASPLDPEFRKRFDAFLRDFTKFQKEVVNSSKYSVTCDKRCSYCCFHWVVDVNSFEAEIVADYVKKNLPEKTDKIIEQCIKDEKQLELVDEIVYQKLNENENAGDEIDSVDLVLSSYYQLERPCPLLNENGECSIYPVRPLTCRIYMSFSDPANCRPGNINNTEIPNYLCDMSEEANQILDRLHEEYIRYEGDNGLRSLLYKYLSE